MNGQRQYLLDTKVLSETRKRQPNPRVLEFLRSAGSTGLYISVLTLGEFRKVAALKLQTDPVAARSIHDWVDGLELGFRARILNVDSAVSRLWGEWSAIRSRPVVDTLLAATALAHGLTLATRNTRNIDDLPVRFVDPWQ